METTIPYPCYYLSLIITNKKYTFSDDYKRFCQFFSMFMSCFKHRRLISGIMGLIIGQHTAVPRPDQDPTSARMALRVLTRANQL